VKTFSQKLICFDVPRLYCWLLSHQNIPLIAVLVWGRFGLSARKIKENANANTVRLPVITAFKIEIAHARRLTAKMASISRPLDHSLSLICLYTLIFYTSFNFQTYKFEHGSNLFQWTPNQMVLYRTPSRLDHPQIIMRRVKQLFSILTMSSH
jgi:hypothetical protein